MNAQLAAVATNEERLLPYWVLLWAEVWKKDYQSVEVTVNEMRAVMGDDEAVDGVLMDLVSELMGPRGEVLLGCILNGSHSEPMRRFATYEMGWVRRFQGDGQGTIPDEPCLLSPTPRFHLDYPRRVPSASAGHDRRQK